jgi:rsbT co-antagonist protein RsbR
MSERQLNTIIGNSNDFIGIATLDGKVGHLNPAGRAMVGLDQGQDLSAIPIEEFHPPEDIALLQETIVPTVLQQGVWSGEFRLRHFQTGATIPVSYSLFQLEDPYTGEVNALGCISRDITEQKQQQTDLEMFRTLVENAPDAISVANLAGTEVYANPVFRERTGYGDQVIGMSIPELYNEPAAAIQQIVQHVMEHGFWQGENSYRRSDKQVMPNLASIFLIHNEDGTPQFIAAIESDITEQKQQQAELEMFRALVENALDGIAYSTPDGIMLYSNASYAAMTGFGDQVAGSTIADYYEPEDAAFVAQTVIPAVIQEGNWQGTLRLRRPNGEHWIGQANLITLKGDAGEITHFIATFRDITQQIADEEERRALAQQVIDAQRDALRELSTPLLPISDDVVIMPLIGTIDSRRAQQVMEALLEGVARHQSRLVILDITGVQVVDTQVAQAFIQAAQAVKLLGATVMLTGIQPQIAQTLVGLGIDLSGIQTQGSLQAGIATALGHTDFRVASRQPGQPA